MRTGAISHSSSQLDALQAGANQGKAADTPYLDPFKAVGADLRGLGYTGPVTILSSQSPPQPTFTPGTGPSGLPQPKILIRYNGKRYSIVLNQPRQQGPSGIWVITQINPA